VTLSRSERAEAFDRMAETLARQNRSDGPSSKTSPTSCGPLSRSSEDPSRRWPTGWLRPVQTQLSSFLDEVLRLGNLVDDLEILASTEAATTCHRRGIGPSTEYNPSNLLPVGTMFPRHVCTSCSSGVAVIIVHHRPWTGSARAGREFLILDAAANMSTISWVRLS
jgi:hypothetical protein